MKIKFFVDIFFQEKFIIIQGLKHQARRARKNIIKTPLDEIRFFPFLELSNFSNS